MNCIKIVLIPFYIGAILISCDEGESESGSDVQPLEVVGFEVTSSHFANSVRVTAELLAKEQVELVAPMDGQVMEIFFTEGQFIKKGGAIIRLDDRKWLAQISGLKAELMAAQKDYDRRISLLQIEGSSQEEVDQGLKTVKSLESRIDELEVNVSLANVRAPFSGVLGMRNFSRGAYLQQSDVITTITAMEQLKVDFSLAQEYKNNVKEGDEVLLMVESDTLQAEIYAINPVIDPSSRTIEVRAILDQTENEVIMPGTFAEVIVAANAVDDARLIPTQAVVPRINEETVFLYKNGKAVRKNITTGERTAEKVCIIDGLDVGDTVIISGLLQVKEGMKVKLQSVEK